MPYDWSVECCDQEESAPSMTTELARPTVAGGSSVVVVTTTTTTPVQPSAWSRSGDDLTYAEIVAGLRRQRQRGLAQTQHMTTTESHSPQPRNVTSISIKTPEPQTIDPAHQYHQPGPTVVQLVGAGRPVVPANEPTARDPPQEEHRSRRPPTMPPKQQPSRPAETLTDSVSSSAVNVTTIVGATSLQPVVMVTSTANETPQVTQTEVSNIAAAGPVSVWSFGNKTYAEVLKEIAASNACGASVARAR